MVVLGGRLEEEYFGFLEENFRSPKQLWPWFT